MSKPPSMTKKSIKTVQFGGENGLIELCHSHPDKSPELDGLFRPRVSVVWARESGDKRWSKTGWKSIPRAVGSLKDNQIATSKAAIRHLTEAQTVSSQ